MDFFFGQLSHDANAADVAASGATQADPGSVADAQAAGRADVGLQRERRGEVEVRAEPERCQLIGRASAIANVDGLLLTAAEVLDVLGVEAGPFPRAGAAFGIAVRRGRGAGGERAGRDES